MKKLLRAIPSSQFLLLTLILGTLPSIKILPTTWILAVKPQDISGEIEKRSLYQNPAFLTFDFFHSRIDPKTGDIRIVKKLDRDLPDGFPQWTMYIFAKDEGGGPTGIENYVELVVTLEDINDNAPYLDMPDGLVWYENRGPGDVGILQAADYDTPENGGPFKFSLDGGANHDMKQWFEVGSTGNGSYVLKALTTFDRERRKSYNIPIKICDHKNLCDISNLLLTIGDVNDNPMEPGHSEV